MVKFIRQPEKIGKFVLLILFLTIPSWDIFADDKSKSVIQLEDLLFYEKVILDYYAGGDLREQAIRSLDTRCRWSDTASGLSCANLSILYKNQGDLPRAYTAAAIAYKKEPKNNYYRNLFQNMALRSDNLRDMERRMGSDGKVLVRYNRAIQSCNEDLGSKVLTDVEYLVRVGHLRKEQFQRGLFHDCYIANPKILESFLKLAKPNNVSYSKMLRDEEDRFNAYVNIWDLDFYRKEVAGEWKEDDIPETELSAKWLAFKKSLSEGNSKKAKDNLTDIKSILENTKKQGAKHKIIAESLELGIQLTLTQDPDLKGLVAKLGLNW